MPQAFRACEEIAVVQAFRPAVSGGPEGPHYNEERFFHRLLQTCAQEGGVSGSVPAVSRRPSCLVFGILLLPLMLLRLVFKLVVGLNYAAARLVMVAGGLLLGAIALAFAVLLPLLPLVLIALDCVGGQQARLAAGAIGNLNLPSRGCEKPSLNVVRTFPPSLSQMSRELRRTQP